MVKSGKARAEKTAMKNDAYVLMLRSKHEYYPRIGNYSKIAFMQYSIDSIIKTVSDTQSLAWGTRGRYHDLTMKLFWKNIDNLDDWLAQGISEAAYNQTKNLIANLANLFYLCAFPRSKMISSLFVTPIPNEVPFSTMEDWLAEITSLSEKEANLLPTLPNTLSILNSQVCAHNIVNSVLVILSPPSVGITGYGVIPLFSNSVVWKLNPDLFPTFTISKTIFSVQNITPSLTVTPTNPNLYNETPTLNISVANT